MPSAASSATIDGRGLPAGALRRVVLDAFDGLAPNEKLRLRCDAPPAEALEALQRDRAGAFEWSPLREGAAGWEVEVYRRAGPIGAKREVGEALAWDHRRLDALEEAAFAARASGRFDQAHATFAGFAHGLRRHIDVEEQLLLPEFEARSGLRGENGPSVVMRAEHRAILAILVIIGGEIGDPEAPVELSRAALRTILHDHELKEEQILHPALDRLFDAAQSDATVARAQAWTRG